MAKETRISFSREHESRHNPERHVDVYRDRSDSSHTEKIDHNKVDPGYGNKEVDVPIRREK